MSILNMYGGELKFEEGRHAYKFNDEPVPGVTTILNVISKPQLYTWYSEMAADYYHAAIKAGRTDYAAINEEAKEAANKRKTSAGASGTNVHAYAEAYFKKLPLPVLETDDSKRGVEAFHKWLDQHNVRALASERMVFSKEHYYAGTCDLVAEIDGEMSVGDIKTGKAIYPEARLQTAAYQHAMQEEKGMKFDTRWVMLFNKTTGDFKAEKFYEFDLDFQGFTSALSLHRILKAITPKRSKK